MVVEDGEEMDVEEEFLEAQEGTTFDMREVIKVELPLILPVEELGPIELVKTGCSCGSFQLC